MRAWLMHANVSNCTFGVRVHERLAGKFAGVCCWIQRRTVGRACA